MARIPTSKEFTTSEKDFILSEEFRGSPALAFREIMTIIQTEGDKKKTLNKWTPHHETINKGLVELAMYLQSHKKAVSWTLAELEMLTADMEGNTAKQCSTLAELLLADPIWTSCYNKPSKGRLDPHNKEHRKIMREIGAAIDKEAKKKQDTIDAIAAIRAKLKNMDLAETAMDETALNNGRAGALGGGRR